MPIPCISQALSQNGFERRKDHRRHAQKENFMLKQLQGMKANIVTVEQTAKSLGIRISNVGVYNIMGDLDWLMADIKSAQIKRIKERTQGNDNNRRKQSSFPSAREQKEKTKAYK